MKTVKMTKEQLINEVRENGTSKETVNKIAEKYGMTAKDVYARIAQYKVKQIIGAEINTPVKEESSIEGISLAQVAIPKKPGLKPKSLVSQDTHLEYSLMAEELVILDPGSPDEHRSIEIPWAILEAVIEELQEIKRITEAG